MTGPRYDVAIIGAGLVGLSVGRALARSLPGVSLLVLDKEPEVASHQSSHNSGVLHSGLYYRPGSLKARLCTEGNGAMARLCEEEEIPFRRTGKLVIASRPSEIPALEELERRGRANGLGGLRRVDAGAIGDFEPHAVGVDGLVVPEAGVVDYPAVARHLAADLVAAGADVLTGRRVTSLDAGRSPVVVGTGHEAFEAGVVVNCAGLHSDRVARLAGIDPPLQIVPFRGEYFRVSDDADHLVRALVYPVPDPRFPFLGVHFTRRIDGSVEVGPNAVPALGREHYRGSSPSWRDVRQTLGYRGFRRLARRYWREGTRELINSRSRRRYARLARRLVPDLRARDLLDGGVGVRAQAVAVDGSLVDDFVIERAGSTVHVLNAPSPGATASLAIGRYLASIVAEALPGGAR